MTSDRSWTHRAAMAFYEWLVVREEREIPPLHQICMMLPEPIDPYRLAGAIRWLGRQDMIDVVRGHKRRTRSHYVIRVRSTGRVYRTANCPIELRERAPRELVAA